MHDFKLIAIRPGDNCNPDFLKALKPGELYQFCNDFTIDLDEVTFKPSYPEDLFKVGKIAVHISAVAGRNGSAKSSLFDLLFAGLYNLSVSEGILSVPSKELKKSPKSIFFELYYKLDEEIYLIDFADQRVSCRIFKAAEGDERKYVRTAAMDADFPRHSFFYSVVINYSFYALNTRELGDWLKFLFHKNDSYQTPVVINPYRNEGTIDINRENDLVQTRLLYSILKEEGLRELAPNKHAKSITLEIDNSKTAEYATWDMNREDFGFDKQHWMADIYEFFLTDKTFVPEDELWNRYAQMYVFSKLESITETYEKYKHFNAAFSEEDTSNSAEDKKVQEQDKRNLFIAYLKLLVTDDSHVAFKVRRAVNFLTYDFISKAGGIIQLDIEKLSQDIFDFADEHGKEVIDLLPPSFLKVDIQLNNGTFKQLSSGEKQKIYSTYSVMYHLINLNSVSDVPIRYRHVSCLFDEIELYYHPDLQRTYIYELLETLKKTDLENIDSVNFTFITHSPFILSDIPGANILYLKVNKKGFALQEKVRQQTFGANIYDLLNDSFFFEKGFIGELAATKIQWVINKLNGHDAVTQLEKVELKQVINMIGEPFLRSKLAEQYEEKFGDTDLRARRLLELQQEMDRLSRKPL